MRSAFRELVVNEGVSAFYKGVIPIMIRAFPANAVGLSGLVHFSSYPCLLEYLILIKQLVVSKFMPGWLAYHHILLNLKFSISIINTISCFIAEAAPT